jgi:hypothetical protein
VATFYLIKGGGSPEFMVYNRPYEPTRGVFPYWEMLAPFGAGWVPPVDPRFREGADLAMYHPDPSAFPAPDTIFAMRGAGQLFGLYRVSQNVWYRRDDIFPPGAWAGGALASHPEWGSTTFFGDSAGEDNSILHCFRGSPPVNPSDEFDCFDVTQQNPVGFWNADAGNPGYAVNYGSDLAFGKVSYRWQGQTGQRQGIWASFGGGNGQWYLGFRYRNQFPWWPGEDGGQSAPACGTRPRRVVVGPSPARGCISFRVNTPASGTVVVHTLTGQPVRRLCLRGGGCTWDLDGDDARRLPDGVYFYVVQVGRAQARGKITVKR